MGAIYKKTFGKMIRATNKRTGKDYSDWRAAYVDEPGLLCIARSERKHVGQSYIYLYPSNDGEDQPWMHTSCGDIVLAEDGCTLETAHSIYEYRFGDYGLDELQKAELCLNVFGMPQLSE